MLISLCLFIISILYNIVHNANTNFSQNYNYSLKEYYDSLFNSIESDNYNLSLIYNYPYYFVILLTTNKFRKENDIDDMEIIVDIINIEITIIYNVKYMIN